MSDRDKESADEARANPDPASRPRAVGRARAGGRHAARGLHWLAVASAWAALLTVSGVEIATRSGLASGWIERRAAGALEPYGVRLELDGARVRWLAPGARAVGARLVDLETGAALARVEELALDFRGPLGGPPRLEHVRLEDGLITIGDALDARLRAFLEQRPKRGHGASELPGVELRRLRLVLDADTGPLELGEVDLDLEAGSTPRTGGLFRPGAFFGAGHLAPIGFDGRYSAETGLQLSSAVRDLALDARTASGLSPLLTRAGLDVARVTLDADAELNLFGGIELDGLRIAARYRDLTAGIASRPRPLTAGSGGFELRYDPALGFSPLSLAGWRVLADLQARLGHVEFGADLLAGAAAAGGNLAELDLHVERFAFDDEGRELVAQMIGAGPVLDQVDQVWAALALGGAARLGVRVAQPVGSKEGLPPPVVFATAEPRSELRVTYHGFPGSDGLRRGFPVTAEDIEARIGFAFDVERERSWRLDWGDFAARQPGGEVFCEGSVGRNPDPLATGYDATHVRLALEVPRLPLGPDVRRGLDGLRLRFDLDRSFAPTAGEAAAKLRIEPPGTGPGLVFEIDVEARGVDGAFERLPLPFRDAHGLLRLRYGAEARRYTTDPPRLVRPFGLAYDFVAVGPGGEPIRAAGSQRMPDLDPRRSQPPERDAPTLGQTWVELRDLELDGPTAAWLLRDQPGLAAALEGAEPQGRVDLDYLQARPEPARGAPAVLEVSGAAIALRPAGGTARIEQTAARMIVSGDLGAGGGDSGNESRPAPLQVLGTAHAWIDDEVELGLALERRALASALDPAPDSEAAGEREARLRVSASGLALDEFPDLPGSTALRGTPAPLDGRIDVFAELPGDLANLGRLRAEDVELSGRLRDNPLTAGRLRLELLRGELARDPDGWLRAGLLEARLARTPLVLRDLALRPTPGDIALETRVFADDLPLDVAHLGQLAPREAVEALVDRALWRGSLDVRGVDLSVKSAEYGGYEIEASGDLVPHDLFVDVGLPLAVSSAKLRLERLAVEGGSVRGFGSVEGLYARIADRVLSDASAVISYAEGRLSLGDLEGQLAGGTLRSFGARVGGGIAVAVDVMPPYRFELSLELVAAQVAELIEGLFPGGATDRGELDLLLRLAGTPGNLSGLRGSGRLRLFNARLWSVPVVRGMFDLLGLDSTATFDEMASRFRLEDAVIHFDEAYAKSPLVKLVGGGTLDLDGTLRQDFELTYSLVDALGPFSKLLYILQNSLLRVSVRGDMGRPRLKLANALSDLLSSDRDQPPGLPLPPKPPLPDRF